MRTWYTTKNKYWSKLADLLKFWRLLTGTIRIYSGTIEVKGSIPGYSSFRRNGYVIEVVILGKWEFTYIGLNRRSKKSKVIDFPSDKRMTLSSGYVGKCEE